MVSGRNLLVGAVVRQSGDGPMKITWPRESEIPPVLSRNHSLAQTPHPTLPHKGGRGMTAPPARTTQQKLTSFRTRCGAAPRAFHHAREGVSTVAANRITVWVAFFAGMCLAPPVAHAQEPKLEPGMKVVARSPGFVLRDGATVIPSASPYDIYRVERVDGDRVRVCSGSREGQARASEVVPVEQAEAYFSDQIKAKPQAAYGYLMRCIARLEKDELASALTDCEQAIRIEPRNPWAYLMRGAVKAAQLEMKNARADFDQAILLDEKIARTYVSRAQCHLMNHDFDRAMADLDEALRRDPTDVTGHAMRGAIWEDTGEHAKALHEFDEGTRLAPKSAFAHIARAECFAERHDFKKAMADADEAIRLEPTDAYGFITRARIAESMEDLDRALADIDQALRLDPKDDEAYLVRASCFLDRKNLEKALANVNEALQLNPRNAEALGLRASILAQGSIRGISCRSRQSHRAKSVGGQRTAWSCHFAD